MPTGRSPNPTPICGKTLSPSLPSGVTFAVIDWLNALCGSGESYSDAIIRVARGKKNVTVTLMHTPRKIALIPEIKIFA